MQSHFYACKVEPHFSYEGSGAYLPDKSKIWSYWLQKLAHLTLKKLGVEHVLTTTCYTYSKTTAKLENAIFESARSLMLFECGAPKFEVIIGHDVFEELMQAKPPEFAINWETSVKYRKRNYAGYIADIPVAYYPHLKGFAVLPIKES